MLNRSSILALTAIAAFGGTALTVGGAYANQNYYRAATTINAGNAASHITSTNVKPVASGYNISKISPIISTGGNSGNSGGNGVKMPYKFGTQLYPPSSKPIDIDCVTFKGCDHDHDHDRDHHYPWWLADWHRPHVGVVEYDTAPVSAPVAASVVATPAAAPCNCLTKRYVDDGSVLFSDLCTKEQAMATPDELKAQQAQNVAQ
jgi:hypothetical protein